MSKLEKPRVVQLTRLEVDGLLSRVEASSLGVDDKLLLKDVVHSQEWMQQALALGKLSIQNLKQMLFGSKSEKRGTPTGLPSECCRWSKSA